jgi:hypothetical protein
MITMLMKNKIFLVCIAVTITLISIGLGYLILPKNIEYIELHNEMTVKPEVSINDTVYNSTTMHPAFWNTSIWNKFNDAYNSRYSDELQKEINDYIITKAVELGENDNIIRSCLNKTNYTEYHTFYGKDLVCLAQKSNFEYYQNQRGKDWYEIWKLNKSELGPIVSEKCWIFVVLWQDCHIKILTISTVDFSVLFYDTCG